MGETTESRDQKEVDIFTSEPNWEARLFDTFIFSEEDVSSGLRRDRYNRATGLGTHYQCETYYAFGPDIPTVCLYIRKIPLLLESGDYAESAEQMVQYIHSALSDIHYNIDGHRIGLESIISLVARHVGLPDGQLQGPTFHITIDAWYDIF